MSHIWTIRRMTAYRLDRRASGPGAALLLLLLLTSLAPGCTLYARWLYVKGTRLDLQGSFDSAAELYRSAVDEDPGLVPARLELANYYYWKQEYRAAEREYMAVLDLDPENQNARKALAQCRLHIIGGGPR